MFLIRLSLQNFRSYSKSTFEFSQGTTIIVGPNTSGKTNIIEAIFFLSTGKSFRAEKDIEAIAFNKEIARVQGEVVNDNGKTDLEIVLTAGQVEGKEAPLKKYLVNGISRRRADFAGNLVTVLFSPMDLDTIVGGPSLRRRFLDEVLEQVDREYRLAHTAYVKALRQRNALLEMAREEGRRNERQFEYWDKLLIENGQLMTKKREDFVAFINNREKDIFDCAVVYDKSVISVERLLQYQDAEVASAITLVGPHRDDFSVNMTNITGNKAHDVKLFGSRGQQRLVILQLKLLTISFIEKTLGQRPLLLLDDIFSELDNQHIEHVLSLVVKQQTILTTTHVEFIPKKIHANVATIELVEGK